MSCARNDLGHKFIQAAAGRAGRYDFHRPKFGGINRGKHAYMEERHTPHLPRTRPDRSDTSPNSPRNYSHIFSNRI